MRPSIATAHVLAAIAAALSLASTRPARAAEPTEEEQAQEARAHYQQGVELYEAGRFEQAAVAFERAHELRPHFKILWNIAQVENELAHYAAALVAYTRYLSEGGAEVPAERRAEAEAEIARLGTLVGTLAIDSRIAGATVFVDGVNRGTTPLAEPIPLDLGDHEVAVRTDAAELHREVVRVAGGREVVVRVGGPGSGEGPDGAARPRVWTWVALGVGGAAAIAGGVLGGVALSEKKRIDADCVDGHCPPGYADDGARVERLALSADVLYGVAGAAVVAGVVLFFVEPKLGGGDEIAVAPAVAADAAGLALLGRF